MEKLPTLAVCRCRHNFVFEIVAPLSLSFSLFCSPSFSFLSAFVFFFSPFYFFFLPLFFFLPPLRSVTMESRPKIEKLPTLDSLSKPK